MFRPSLPVVRAAFSTPVWFRSALPVILAFGIGGPARGDVLSWVATDLTGVDVMDVAIEPGGSGRIWAATAGRGLLLSTDGGKTFAPSPSLGKDARVFGIDFDPENWSVVYAATADGLYRVTAATAERLWLRDPDPTAMWVSVDPHDPRVLLLGASGGCIYRSADRGITWSPTRCGTHPYRSRVGRALFDPSGTGLVLATAYDWYPGSRLLRSGDRGATWSYVDPAQVAPTWPNLAVDPEPPGEGNLSHRVWCASTLSPGLLVSRDFGLNWSSVVAAKPGAKPEAFGALALTASGRILSAGPGGIFQTDRTGSPWAPSTVGRPSGEVRRIVALDDAGAELLLATSTGLYRTERTAEVPAAPVLLPTIVDAVGRGGARFTTSFTLYNASDGMAEGTVDYVASESAGSAGSGSFPFRIPAREQLVVGDASTWLRAAGLAVPEATPDQPQVGTLTIRSSDGLWGGEVVAVARVTTPSGPGLSGTGLWSLPASSLTTTPSYLPGLRETAEERTNVAVANAGTAGTITLRATFRHAAGTFTREAELGPGQWAQWNAPLGSEGVPWADATIERIAGDEPYTAYATIVDQSTNDGSFLPARPAPAAGAAVVPVVVEANGFETELVLFNPGSVDATASLVFTDSLDPAPGGIAPTPSLAVPVPARGSVVLPRVIDELRRRGVPIGPTTASQAGPLCVEAAADGHPVPILASARTTIPAPSGGAYGVSYPALSPDDLARSEAWVTGLGPASEVRSNLALLNPGTEVVTLEWTVFPGSPGGWPRGLEGTVTLRPGEWKQILLEDAGDTYRFPVRNVVVRVRKTSGPGPFAAYGVVNDGKSPGLGTGDGTYIPMSATR